MKSIKLPIILDTFFIFFISLFFFYALILYGIGGYALTIFLSTVIAIIISSLFIVYSSIKNDLKYSKENEKQNIKNFNYNLYFTSADKLLEILKEYYVRQNKSVTLNKTHLIINEDNEQIFPIIKPEEITLTDIIKVVKSSENNLKIKILAVNYNSNCQDFINEIGLNVEILKSEDLYFMLKNEDINVNSIEINPLPKKRLSNYFNKIFTKKQYKRFLATGLIITVSSYFSFYPVYYLIFGGILIFLGVYLKLFKKD